MEKFSQQLKSDQGSETKEQKMRRLLGIRRFPQRTDEEKRELLGSDERLRVLNRIETVTLPAKTKAEVKKGIVLELVKSHLISDEVLRNHPLVYLGSGMDIEYPLAVGGRNIILVDPIFINDESVKNLLDKIKKISKESIQLNEDRKINFTFDFGSGKENVSVQLEVGPYGMPGGYQLPDNTGLIVMYASGVSTNDEMKSKITVGGAILEETGLLTKDLNTGEEKVMQFGEL